MQLIFVHIPKTAGTSLRTVIAQNFLPWNIEQMYTQGRHAERAQEIVRRSRRGRSTALLGHVGYGVHRSVGLEDAKYLTMLREPVDRVISMYRHIKRDPHHQFHAPVSTMSLEEYVESGLDESASNSQTRFLSGAKWENELAGRDDANDFAGRTEERALADALAVLEGSMTVGISERFLESVAVLVHRLELRWAYWGRLNVADPWSPVPERTRAMIRETNRLDHAVYQHALEVHRHQYREVPDAGERVAELERQRGPIPRIVTKLAERSLAWSR